MIRFIEEFAVFDGTGKSFSESYSYVNRKVQYQQFEFQTT